MCVLRAHVNADTQSCAEKSTTTAHSKSNAVEEPPFVNCSTSAAESGLLAGNVPLSARLLVRGIEAAADGGLRTLPDGRSAGLSSGGRRRSGV
eukprot:614673-Rhodomonas_salina.1